MAQRAVLSVNVLESFVHKVQNGVRRTWVAGQAYMKLQALGFTDYQTRDGTGGIKSDECFTNILRKQLIQGSIKLYKMLYEILQRNGCEGK